MDFSGSIALAFDLDDTLYDERDYARACIANVARHCAEAFGSDAIRLEADMLAAPNPYDGLRGTIGDKLPIDAFLKIYRATEPDSLPLREDARRLLEVLACCPNIPIYLITDGRCHGQQAKINALGITDLFTPERIIISEAIGFDKHTPMPFVTAMARENRHSGWCYIGDNLAKDFYWPRRLGWSTFMVTDRGRNVHPQPPLKNIAPEYRPDFVIDSLDYLTSQICQSLSLQV